MRARSPRAPSADAVDARRTRRVRSRRASSVARMASSVDLPAPFGPSSPTMSPAARGEGDVGQRPPTAEVPPDAARRRRGRSRRSRRRSRTAGQPVELGVDLLGGRHQTIALGRRPRARAAPRPALRRRWRRSRRADARAPRPERRARACAPGAPRHTAQAAQRANSAASARATSRGQVGGAGRPENSSVNGWPSASAAGGAHHEDLAARFALADWR